MSDKFVLYFNKMKQNPLLDRKQCVSSSMATLSGWGQPAGNFRPLTFC